MIRQPTLCYWCIHRGESTEDDEPTCAAYPNGIPSEIIDDGYDHREPAPGDNGIRFEPEPDMPVDFLERFDRRASLSVPQ